MKLAQKDHITLRKTFLDNMIEELDKEKNESNKDRIKALKVIRSIEQVIKAFRSIKFRRPKGLRQQINQLQVPTDNSDDPKDIELDPHKWTLLLTQEEILTSLLH